MYILSKRDQRAEFETLTADRTGPAPSFGETFSASFDFAQDEMLSISSMFNNQALSILPGGPSLAQPQIPGGSTPCPLNN